MNPWVLFLIIVGAWLLLVGALALRWGVAGDGRFARAVRVVAAVGVFPILVVWVIGGVVWEVLSPLLVRTLLSADERAAFWTEARRRNRERYEKQRVRLHQHLAARVHPRLEAPDFESLERHFGSPTPPPLRRLYENRELLFRSEFEFESLDEYGEERNVSIRHFLPAQVDAEDLEFIDEHQDGYRDSYREEVPEGESRLFPFAEEQTEGTFCIPWELCRDECCPVVFTGPEMEGFTRVADTLDEFLSRPVRMQDEFAETSSPPSRDLEMSFTEAVRWKWRRSIEDD